jgi:hypothetical protein
MGNLTESFPVSATAPGAIWDFFPDVNRTQWQWEAPTIRPQEKPPPPSPPLPALPNWLMEWNMIPKPQHADISREEEKSALTKKTSSFEDELAQLQDSASTLSSDHDIEELFLGFYSRFQQNIALGTVREETLLLALHQVTEAIRELVKRGRVSKLCSDFYVSVWQGIGACKVLRPIDYDGKTLDCFLSLISRIQMTPVTECLAQDILMAVSGSQLASMEPGINDIIREWTYNWLGSFKLPTPEFRALKARLPYIESSLRESSRSLKQASNFIFRKDLSYDERMDGAKRASCVARDMISDIGKYVTDLERSISPRAASVKRLADALKPLSSELLSRLVPTYSQMIIEACKRDMNPHSYLRYGWLSVVAQLPNTGERLFVATWQIIEAHHPTLTHKSEFGASMTFNEGQCSSLILCHWISQGYISKPFEVRNRFEASANSARIRDRKYALLLAAVTLYKERSFVRTRDLFRLATHVTKFPRTYEILRQMADLHLKVPLTIFRQILNTMVTPVSGRIRVRHENIERALMTYFLHFQMRPGTATLKLEAVPKLVIALINCHEIPSSRIWAILRIPPYKYLSRKGALQQNHSRLSPRMVILIHSMATAFAHSKARTGRMAAENIDQCLWHLRMHRAPIGPEISRALCHAVITRSINDGGWVVTERLRWALKIVEILEGKVAAEKVHTLVLGFRAIKDSALQEEKLIRTGNLSVGPID